MDEGAEQLVAAMKELPPEVVLLTNVGVALLTKGYPQDAIEFFEYALKLQPNDANAHVNLATAYKEAAQTDRAIEELNKAIDLDPQLEGAYHQLAEIYIRKSNRVELRHLFEQYKKAIPTSLTASQALADLDSARHSH